MTNVSTNVQCAKNKYAMCACRRVDFANHLYAQTVHIKCLKKLNYVLFGKMSLSAKHAL